MSLAQQFKHPGMGEFTPNDLPNLVHWFDPSRHVLTGGADDAVDEDPVSDWLDSTGLVNDAQSIGNDPSYETSGISPQIVFDGTDDSLVLVGAVAFTAGFGIAWVSELLNGAPANETIFGNSGAAGVFVRQLSTTQTRISDGTNTRTFTHAAVSGRTIFMITGNAASGLECYVNGVQAAGAGTSFDAITLDEFGSAAAATYGEFGMGDAIFNDGPFTEAEINNTGRFLA